MSLYSEGVSDVMTNMKSNKHGAIGVRSVETGKLTFCASGDPGANYHTLCGVSLDDDLFKAEEAPPTARINCNDCHHIWKLARAFKAADFTKDKS